LLQPGARFTFLSEYISTELLLFIGLGVLAQLVDGALGMAYGLIATTVLLSIGTPPAMASASVHAAEIVTTGLAGASHAWHKNIDWKLFRRLAPAGVAGGVIGAYVLIGLPENLVKFFITLYLLGMTVLITRRILRNKKAEEGSKKQREKKLPTIPVGVGGGFLDAIGGGGWGPLVTSTLLARGDHPRRTIGTATLSEFFLTLSISIAFVLALNVMDYWRVVVGLIVGGAMAAPFAGLLGKLLAPRTLMIMVAAVLAALCVFNLVRLVMTLLGAAG
jgi:uncharacterized membrane protein YfcA